MKNAMVAQAFARNLRRARRRAGMSQEALSFASGLHRTEVGLLERSARIPRIDTIVKLAAGLDIAPEELLAGIHWQAPDVGRCGEFVVPSEDNPD
jgi:transcriptional regulator with XRE-family HTH domain